MENKGAGRLFTKTWAVVPAALLCCALWGSAIPCIKVGNRLFSIAGTDSMTQILFAGVRFVLAGVMVLLFGSFASKKPLVPKTLRTWGHAAALGSLQTVAQYVLFYIGLARTTGVKGSIIVGTNVFVSIAVSCLLFRQEKLTKEKLLGSVLGFAGLVLLNLPGGDVELKFNFWGDGLVFLSTVAYSFSSVFMKKFSKQDDPVTLSGWQFLLGGAVMTAVGFLAGGRLSNPAPGGIALLVYLAFVSAAAYTLWGVLLKYNNISRIAVFGFTNPAFGVMLSGLLLGETAGFGALALCSLALIAAGILIVHRQKENV